MPSPSLSRRSGGGGGDGTTTIHVTALDAICTANSLYTFAVFLGLSWDPTDRNAHLAGHCAPPDAGIGEAMVTFQVLSFGSFLFSSIVALCLKEAARIRGDYLPPAEGRRRRLLLRPETSSAVHRVSGPLLRWGLALSAAGSVSGCCFLMLALVDMVQIKLGTLGCSGHTVAAVVPLLVLVPVGLLVYISMICYAFTR